MKRTVASLVSAQKIGAKWKIPQDEPAFIVCRGESGRAPERGNHRAHDRHVPIVQDTPLNAPGGKVGAY